MTTTKKRNDDCVNRSITEEIKWIKSRVLKPLRINAYSIISGLHTQNRVMEFHDEAMRTSTVDCVFTKLSGLQVFHRFCALQAQIRDTDRMAG